MICNCGRMRQSSRFGLAACLVHLAPTALADPAVIEAVTADQRAGGWTISVTLRHPDTGWDHYADGWEVLDADGQSLGFRELVHPHVNEQPFTRSLAGVSVPSGTDHLTIRARDNVDGWGGEPFRIDLQN